MDEYYTCPCGYKSKYKGNVTKHKNKCSDLMKINFNKEIDKYKEEICRLKNIIRDKEMIIHEKQYSISAEILQKKDDIIAEKDRVIQEKETKISSLHDENVRVLRAQNDALLKKPGQTNINNKITIINNTIENLLPIEFDKIGSYTDKLEIEHLESPEGIAEYALAHPLKDRMICVDLARKNVKYKDHLGNISTDKKMNKLTSLIFDSIEKCAGVDMDRLCGDSQKQRKAFKTKFKKKCCEASLYKD